MCLSMAAFFFPMCLSHVMWSGWWELPYLVCKANTQQTLFSSPSPSFSFFLSCNFVTSDLGFSSTIFSPILGFLPLPSPSFLPLLFSPRLFSGCRFRWFSEVCLAPPEKSRFRRWVSPGSSFPPNPSLRRWRVSETEREPVCRRQWSLAGVSAAVCGSGTLAGGDRERAYREARINIQFSVNPYEK